MKHLWDIQAGENWWLSLGFHVDHTDPSLTLHFPFLVVAFGRLRQPGFTWSLRDRWETCEKHGASCVQVELTEVSLVRSETGSPAEKPLRDAEAKEEEETEGSL